MRLGLAGLTLATATQSNASWCFFTKYPAEEGRPLRNEEEVVHFLSIGDWGSQPASLMNGGSMHAACSQNRGQARCSYHSDSWYREENAQVNVMNQMKKIAAEHPPKFIVNVGDNFYFEGVTDTCHWHWRDQFENMYSDASFHVPWLSVLGNHDYGGDCCARDLFGGCNSAQAWLGFGGRAHPTSQFEYDTDHEWTWPAKKESRWVMPYWNYGKIFDFGPYKAHIIAIDTNVCDIAKQCTRMGGCSNSGTHPEVAKRNCNNDNQCACFMTRLWLEQLDYLDSEFGKHAGDPKIKWRFVIGHHPSNFIFPGDGPSQRGRFLSILKKYNVQVYFAGHVHSSRHDIIAEGVHQVMTGASGGYEWQGGNSEDTIWSSGYMEYGFAHMELTEQQLKVNYVNDRGEVRKTVTIDQVAQYKYQAGEWGPCDNNCGKGYRYRNLKCTTQKGDQEVGMEHCQNAGAIKPNTRGECYATAAPTVDYCLQCGTDTTCEKCVDGFHAENGKCVSSSRFLRVEYGVVAPASDEWRELLDDMLHNALKNATSEHFTVHTDAAFLQQNPVVTEAHPMVVRMAQTELNLDHYTVRAVVEGQSEAAEGKMKQLLKKYKDSIDAFPPSTDPSCPDVSDIHSFKSVCAMKDCSTLTLDEELVMLEAENAELRATVKETLIAQNEELKVELEQLV
mmetsp:Transcript_34462/g.83191  ORF Transcript_34462/g.83191 Transcript_34462/m.83191 type:complete len:675 (+) Transcript_34462:67-2091(+)